LGTISLAISLLSSSCICRMSSVEILPPPSIFDWIRSVMRWLRVP